MNIQTITHNDLSFVLVTSPQELEYKELIHNFGIKPYHLDEYMYDQMIPKIESNDDYTMMVLDFPFVENPGEKHEKGETTDTNVEDAEKDAPFPLPNIIPHFLFSQSEKRRIRTAHTMFFIGKNFVIVIHDEKSPEITTLFHHIQSSLKSREEMMGYGAYYLYYCVMTTLVRNAYNVMRGITSMIEDIDIHVLESDSASDIVEDISLTRRNIVFFRSMIDQSVHIFSDIVNGKNVQFTSDTKAHWNSIYSHLQKIRNRLHRSQELLEGIATSHESLITVRTNEIVKILTMFTAILLPLTLVTGFYGMNIVGLPKAEAADGLFILTAVMIFLAVAMAGLFKIKKWI